MFTVYIASGLFTIICHLLALEPCRKIGFGRINWTWQC